MIEKGEIMKPKKKVMDTREKVFRVALEEFAAKGFKEVSTREITRKAGVNLSSIKYYFGDKEKLYRAVYEEPMLAHREKMNNIGLDDTKSLEDNLRNLLFTMVDPLREGKEIEWCMILHVRESIEKTGLVEDSKDEFKKITDNISIFIKREIPKIDDKTLKRLVLSIISQPVFMFIGKDLIDNIDKDLLGSKSQIDAWVNKSVFYSLKMIELEKDFFK